MVCVLDSTGNFKEMHKLKLYAVCKGGMTFSFMAVTKRQGQRLEQETLRWDGHEHGYL